MLTGTLAKDKKVDFVKVLGAVANFITDDDGGIIINVDKEKLEANIFAKKDSAGTLIFVKYNPSMFTGFTIDKDERIGVLKINDFIRYFSVIDEDKVIIKFDNNDFSITGADSGAESSISFRTADVDLIKEGLKSFKGTTWLSEIIVDEKLDKLKTAMDVLKDEECVFIKGDAKQGTVTFTVKSSGVEINKFKITLAATVSQDFDTPYSKEYLQNVLKMPTKTVKIMVADRFISVYGVTDNYSITYYLAKKTLK